MHNQTVIKIFNSLTDESRKIREEVFVSEQGFKEEFDTVDNRATHFVAYGPDDTAIGTCRIFIEDDPRVFFLGRLAVLRSYRHMNIGSMLVEAAENTARSMGGFEIRLHSQCRAMEFYQKCGYEVFSDIEYEENCPHVWMRKQLDRDQID